MNVVFAYGSNMLLARMQPRAPSARRLGSAFLECFRLCWNKRSKDGSGKCSIEETGQREHFVWGVLYELTDNDKKTLDRFEGLGNGYGERTITVLSNGAPCRVSAYYATSIDLAIRPYDWYRDLVVAGAHENGFPNEYIRTLEEVAVVVDSDHGRATSERAALGRL